MNTRSSVASNRTSSLFILFYIVILSTSLHKEKRNLFRRPSSSFSFRRDAGCLCFRNGALQSKTRPHLLWTWRCYNEVGGRGARQCAFIGTLYRASLHLPSSQQSSPTFSLFTRRISSPSAVFHSSPFPFLALTLCENVRFLLFVRASSKLLSEWLRRVVTRLTRVHSFPFSAPMSQFLGNLDGYRPLLIFTIRGAILPSFHPTVIKWAFLIVSDTKDRISEIFLFLPFGRMEHCAVTSHAALELTSFFLLLINERMNRVVTMFRYNK